MAWILLWLYFGADTKNQRTRDSINIINYIYNNFEYIDISDYIQNSFAEYEKNYTETAYLYKTTSIPDIELSTLTDYTFPLKPNTSNLLTTKFYTLNSLSSNIKKGDKIGCMTVYYDDKILLTVDIVLSNDLVQNSWQYYFVEVLKQFNFTFLNENCI